MIDVAAQCPLLAQSGRHPLEVCHHLRYQKRRGAFDGRPAPQGTIAQAPSPSFAEGTDVAALTTFQETDCRRGFAASPLDDFCHPSAASLPLWE